MPTAAEPPNLAMKLPLDLLYKLVRGAVCKSESSGSPGQRSDAMSILSNNSLTFCGSLGEPMAKNAMFTIYEVFFIVAATVVVHRNWNLWFTAVV